MQLYLKKREYMDFLEKIKNRGSTVYFIDVDHKGQYSEIVDYFYQIALKVSQTHKVIILHDK